MSNQKIELKKVPQDMKKRNCIPWVYKAIEILSLFLNQKEGCCRDLLYKQIYKKYLLKKSRGFLRALFPNLCCSMYEVLFSNFSINLCGDVGINSKNLLQQNQQQQMGGAVTN